VVIVLALVLYKFLPLYVKSHIILPFIVLATAIIAIYWKVEVPEEIKTDQPSDDDQRFAEKLRLLFDAPWFKAAYSPDDYHRIEHPADFIGLAVGFLRHLGFDDEVIEFILDVIALHDFDPDRIPGSRPKVPGTLKRFNEDWRGIRGLDGIPGH